MARKTRAYKKSKKARVTRNRRLAKFQLGGGEDDDFVAKRLALLETTGFTNEFKYNQKGKEIKNKGIFIPGPGYDSNKHAEYIRKVEANPDLMTSGGIYNNITRLGETETVKNIGFKMPSLNTAIFLSDKPLAKEFWHTLTWDKMPSDLKDLNETPLPNP